MHVSANINSAHQKNATRRLWRAGSSEVHAFNTDDGVELKLTRYPGGSRGPVMLVHCIGVSSGMYTTETIETTLTEDLFAAGFDVWLLDMRLSIDLPAHTRQSSFDEIAEYDYPAAVALIRAHTQAESIQVVAHGIGSQTFCMAMLSGLQGVRSAVCSQVAIHPIPAGLNRIKSRLGLPKMMGAIGMQLLSAPPRPQDGWRDRGMSLGAKLHPVQREERCDSLTCKRITAMYGPLYEHDALNAATHAALPELFGQANLRSFRHLIRNLSAGHVVQESGADVYMPQLQRMAIPIAFLHGADNDCLSGESTRLTKQLLAERNGSRLYKRHVIPNYGHVDCIIGAQAHRDVFPLIRNHLMETAA